MRPSNPVPLLLIFCIFLAYALVGELDRTDAEDKAYQQGYQEGLKTGKAPIYKCSTNAALKWWTNANNLFEVKRALCSNHRELR